jgi:hypothetical protein
MHYSNILLPRQNVATCILSVGHQILDPEQITTTSGNLKVAPNNGLGLLANRLNLTFNGATDAGGTAI